MTGANPAILEANLRGLARTCPAMVAAIRTTTPRADLTWVVTPSGALSATMPEVATAGPMRGTALPRWLASRKDPEGEGRELAGAVSVAQTPVVVVAGFGLGYHVAELARRMKRTGLIVVLEPDVGLLRAALERIDCTEWLDGSNVVIVSDAGSDTAIGDAVAGLDPMLALGVKLVDHPASLSRLGGVRSEFFERFTRVLRAARMNVVTTLVQTEATLRNLTQNLDHYALGGGVEPLRGALTGRPALLIAAGPSLQRSLALLEDPAVRDRFVIIAVQTVLKTLLARGIRPHFVTALDFHEISRRFYEGLTARDVEGVTLVVEPKVNPAVTEAWPGPAGSIRCTGDAFLDELLGTLARPMGAISPGATVAHLNHHLARHLGCDPVILVGQDLGFTDGQYYADRAAIHDVWAGELSPVRTLEMFEWERIARMRPQLTKQTDVLGRPIYTDEQMHTYLVGFQRMFAEDARRGLTTLDATGGGVRKQHAEPVDLGETLARYGVAGTGAMVERALSRPDGSDRSAARSRAVKERLSGLIRDVRLIARRSRETAGHLRDMADHHADQARVNRLIGKVEAIRDEVTALAPAFGMVERLNQTGTLNRTKADRKIYIENDQDPMAVQRAQIERDLTNVTWLGDAADQLAEILSESLGVMEGKPRRTRPPAAAAAGPDKSAAASAERVWGVVSLRPGFSGLGMAPAGAWMGADPLVSTVARLLKSRMLEGVAVVCDDGGEARRRLGPLADSPRVRVLDGRAWSGAPASALRAARALCPHSWRGGLAGWTVYDEALDAPGAQWACERLGATAALIAGEDWTLIDPALCDALVARYRESPETHRMTFCQAGAGLCGIVMARSLLADLARTQARGGVWATVGGLLSYLPHAPTSDVIAKPSCVTISPAVRDALVRCIPDTASRGAWLERAIVNAGLDAGAAGAEDVARVLESHARAERPACPSVVRWELGGPTPAAAQMHGAAVEVLAHDAPMDVIAAGVEYARRAGAGAVHVRVDLDREGDDLSVLLSPGVDTVSVDLYADDAWTYARLTGRDEGGLARAQANVARLMAGRRGVDGEGVPTAFASATPWIVPRITRRDEVYEQIEGWYVRWLMACRCAIIDALPAPVEGARITPLTLPGLAARRASLDTAEYRAGVLEGAAR